MVSLNSWAESDIGRKRANNEDSFFHNQGAGLFIVADGMGGHRGGEKASKLATKTSKDVYLKKVAEGVASELALEQAFLSAARKVYEKGMAESSLKGMGTTLSILAISDHQAFIGHIGDTRIYCIRDGAIHQLTTDHSLVNEQVQAGIMSQEEARVSALRNIITRAIGHNENARADYFSIPIKQNDIFLLCTDGLNNMLLDTEIVEIIRTIPPDEAVKQLVLKANDKGGDDNITVILVKVSLAKL